MYSEYSKYWQKQNSEQKKSETKQQFEKNINQFNLSSKIRNIEIYWLFQLKQKQVSLNL